jgi:hypothetical protein
MTIALRILAVREETLWYDQMEIVLGAGHGYMEDKAFPICRPPVAVSPPEFR